ncbi:unnamed protein product, partial [marine sediment metagenome]
LKEKMGTLEAVDALKEKMEAGKYSFVFDKTKSKGITTIFITQPGQFSKTEEVIRKHGNSKAIANAAKRFDGDTQINPKTGQMEASGGTLGLYIHSQKVAIINLPLINKSAKNLDKALETVVHEHVHGLIGEGMAKLARPQQEAFVAELEMLWESIDKDWLNLQRINPDVSPRTRAGINQTEKSITELVTYAMAHPEFAAWLNKIPASPRFQAKKSRIKTIWDALMDLVVTKVLKMPSKYDELVSILNRNMKFGEQNQL